MIDPTSVPVPCDAWVAARRDHLLAELRRTPERRGHRRLVGGMGALAAAGAVTAAGLLIAGGPAASTAFAGWRAAPTAPAPRQLPAAEASCPAGGSSPGGKVGPPGAVPSGPPALSDVRGPYSMLLYLDGDGGSTLCMSGGSFVRVLPTPAPTAPAPAVDGLVIDHLASGVVTFVEGRVGSQRAHLGRHACNGTGAEARRTSGSRGPLTAGIVPEREPDRHGSGRLRLLHPWLAAAVVRGRQGLVLPCIVAGSGASMWTPFLGRQRLRGCRNRTCRDPAAAIQ